MGKETAISWCDHTFNPWWGCTNVSPACDHCYAEAFSKRTGHGVWGKDAPRRFFEAAHWREPLKWDKAAGEAGVRRRVFCGSMCDVMEEREDLSHSRVRLYNLICDTPQLDWLLLTKRPQNFRRFLPASWLDCPRPNVWLMTTVESPDYYWRIKALTDCPAVVHGLSLEPLLAPLPNLPLRDIEWVIVGGESGGGFRALNPDWARALRDECLAGQVPFFFKQWGGIRPTTGGCLLDGLEWKQFPGVAKARGE